jgi:hypothetical protein
VSTFALVCKTPTKAVLAWLNGNGGQVDTGNVRMVDVGTGLQAGSDWWVVAAPTYDFGTDDNGNVFRSNKFIITWLTDTPSQKNSVNATWISLYEWPGTASKTSEKATVTWANVGWTGARLTRGQQAQTKAVGCLS